MPRRLLRDGVVTDDDWTYLDELSPDAATSVEATLREASLTQAPAQPQSLIMPLEHWLNITHPSTTHRSRLGVILQPSDRVEQITADLSRFELIGAQFPGPSDGRGYSQGRLLRERYGFRGELRACGYVRRDQLFFLARCGFNSFEMADEEIDAAASAFATFTAEYQPSNDRGLPRALLHR